MTSELISPPDQLAVTLDQAKANLRVDGSYMDALITTWVEGIIADLEHETGRALVYQGRSITLDRFSNSIRLYRIPIATVDSIQYVDVDGQLQTLHPDDYLLDPRKGYVVPAPGRAWPATLCRIDTVTVRYTCGYGPTAATVPREVKLYILAKLVEQFDPVSRTERDTVQSNFVTRLLDACRTYG